MNAFVVRADPRSDRRASPSAPPVRGEAPERTDDAAWVEGRAFRLEPGGPRLGPDPREALVSLVRARGPEALARVEGDFVACVRVEGTLHAFKSFASQHQLYLRGDTVANRLAPLLADAGASAGTLDLDEGYFARHVLMLPGLQHHGPRTPVRGVTRLLPGELASFARGARGPTRRSLVTRRYRYRLDPAQRREEVAPRVLELLRAIVADHLAHVPPGGAVVELSGGLDSSFVACLVGEVRPGARAVMFTRPELPSHRASETYARSVAERYGLDLELVPREALPRGSSLDAPPYADEPTDFFWFGDVFSRAVAERTPEGGAVFTGFGADQLFLRSPAFLAHLLGRRAFGAFARTLGPVARLLSRSPTNLAWQAALSQLPRATYHRLAAPFTGRSFDPTWVGDVNVHLQLRAPVPWLARAAAHEAFERERRALETARVGDGVVCDDWGYFAAPRAIAGPFFAAKGLADASPYCDLRLVDFVYDEVSALLVHDFRGRYKELLREAQRGVVPDDLRARANDMFVFNAFLTDWLDASADAVPGLLDELPAGWIDRAEVARAFEALRFGAMTASTRSVVALVGYAAWLRAFRAAPFC